MNYLNNALQSIKKTKQVMDYFHGINNIGFHNWPQVRWLQATEGTRRIYTHDQHYAEEMAAYALTPENWCKSIDLVIVCRKKKI